MDELKTIANAKDAIDASEADDPKEKVLDEEPSFEVEDQAMFDEMMSRGVFYGRSKSRTNPHMKDYVLTTRSGFEVLDVQKSIRQLKDAAKVVKDVIARRGTIVLVGTSSASKFAIAELAKRVDLPHVTERWLGGTITNFDTIKGRISHFKKLKEDKATGNLEKYTKKEQLKLDRELTKLSKFFGGIESLDKLPDMVFIADLNENESAAREARLRGIPIVAIVNSDSDPTLADYVIPCNDRNSKSIELVLEHIEAAMKEGMALAQAPKAEAAQVDSEKATGTSKVMKAAKEAAADSVPAKEAEAKTPKEEK